MLAINTPATAQTVTRCDSAYARKRSSLVMVPGLLLSYRVGERETQTRLVARHPDLGGDARGRILSVQRDRAGGAPLGKSAPHHGASPAAHRGLGPQMTC